MHATESIEHVPTQTRIRRYALAVSAAQELGDSDTISVLLPHLSRLVNEYANPGEIDASIRVAADAASALGDELGARRLLALISPTTRR